MSKTALMSYQYQSQQSSSSIVAQKVNKEDGSVVNFEGSAYSMTESLSLSITDGNRTLDILYERTISAIEVEIEEISQKNPLVASYLEGGNIDYSPEATADRIVNFATSFFEVHRARHENLSDEEALGSYMNVIGDAIDKGFSEAREILDSLNVLQGEVKENIDTTYDLIQEKLSLFEDSFSFGQE